jgi:hypothetical protein
VKIVEKTEGEGVVLPEKKKKKKKLQSEKPLSGAFFLEKAVCFIYGVATGLLELTNSTAFCSISKKKCVFSN